MKTKVKTVNFLFYVFRCFSVGPPRKMVWSNMSHKALPQINISRFGPALKSSCSDYIKSACLFEARCDLLPGHEKKQQKKRFFVKQATRKLVALFLSRIIASLPLPIISRLFALNLGLGDYCPACNESAMGTVIRSRTIGKLLVKNLNSFFYTSKVKC